MDNRVGINRVHGNVILNFTGTNEEAQSNINERIRRGCIYCECFAEPDQEQALLKTRDLCASYRTFSTISKWLINTVRIKHELNVPLIIKCPTSSADGYQGWHARHVKKLEKIKIELKHLFESATLSQKKLMRNNISELRDCIEESTDMNSESIKDILDQIYEEEPDLSDEILINYKKEHRKYFINRKIRSTSFELPHDAINFMALLRRQLLIIHPYEVEIFNLNSESLSQTIAEQCAEEFPYTQRHHFHSMAMEREHIALSFQNDICVFSPSDDDLELKFKTDYKKTLDKVGCLAFTDRGDDRLLFAGLHNGVVDVYPLAQDVFLEKGNYNLDMHKKPVTAIKVRDQFVFSGSTDRLIKKWDIETKKTLFKCNLDTGVHNIELNPNNGSILAASNSRGVTSVLQTNVRRRPLMFDIPCSLEEENIKLVYTGLIWRNERSLLVGQGNTITEWDISSKKSTFKISLGDVRLTSMCIDTESQQIYCGIKNNEGYSVVVKNLNHVSPEVEQPAELEHGVESEGSTSSSENNPPAKQVPIAESEASTSSPRIEKMSISNLLS